MVSVGRRYIAGRQLAVISPSGRPTGRMLSRYQHFCPSTEVTPIRQMPASSRHLRIIVAKIQIQIILQIQIQIQIQMYLNMPFQISITSTENISFVKQLVQYKLHDVDHDQKQDNHHDQNLEHDQVAKTSNKTTTKTKCCPA